MLLSDGTRHVRYFLINASMGILAEGNQSFNNARGLTAWLKPRNVEAAIVVTAVRNIATFRPINLALRGDDWRRDGELTNVSILKSVHFAGGMRYDTGVTRDDGLFDVNVWEPAGRLALVRLAAGLYRGRFKGSPYARCERAGRVEQNHQCARQQGGAEDRPRQNARRVEDACPDESHRQVHRREPDGGDQNQHGERGTVEAEARDEHDFREFLRRVRL